MSGQWNGRRKGQFASRQSLQEHRAALLSPISHYEKQWVYPDNLKGVSNNSYKVLKWVKVEVAVDQAEQDEEIRLNALSSNGVSSMLASTMEANSPNTPNDVGTPPSFPQSGAATVAATPTQHPLAHELVIPQEIDPAKPATKEMGELMHTVDQEMTSNFVQQKNEEAVAVVLDEKVLN